MDSRTVLKVTHGVPSQLASLDFLNSEDIDRITTKGRQERDATRLYSHVATSVAIEYSLAHAKMEYYGSAHVLFSDYIKSRKFGPKPW